MTDAERIRHAAKLIKLFEHSRNPKDRHRIVIVDEISRVHLGQTEPLVTLKTAFRCLACGALTVRAQCPRPDCTYCRYPPWQSCGLRFFCDSCAGYQKDRQVKQWLWLIMGVLKGSNLGPVSGTRLEWMLPDVRDAGNILRFGDHIRHTFADRLYGQSITPCQWMLATAIDPMRGTLRGLYLGPPDTRLVTVGFSWGNCNNSGTWVPRVGTVALPHSGR